MSNFKALICCRRHVIRLLFSLFSYSRLWWNAIVTLLCLLHQVRANFKHDAYTVLLALKAGLWSQITLENFVTVLINGWIVFIQAECSQKDATFKDASLIRLCLRYMWVIERRVCFWKHDTGRAHMKQASRLWKFYVVINLVFFSAGVPGCALHYYCSYQESFLN